jgi:hypothetical protein
MTTPKREHVLPPVVTTGGLSVLPVSPDKAFIRCTCGHAAWRVADGSDEWECGCPIRKCHGPQQVADDQGTPQLVWAPFRIRPFPAPTGGTA